MIAKSDVRCVEAQYRYGVLGGMLHIHYSAANDEDILYHYDQTANAGPSVGRLTQVVYSSGLTDYRYNQRGYVMQQHLIIQNIDLTSQGSDDWMQLKVKVTHTDSNAIETQRVYQSSETKVTLEQAKEKTGSIVYRN